jgi:hypothetical protein
MENALRDFLPVRRIERVAMGPIRFVFHTASGVISGRTLFRSVEHRKGPASLTRSERRTGIPNREEQL